MSGSRGPQAGPSAWGRHDLAPGLLLASPSLRDPNFEKSVVLLGRHDAEGALGWVINGKEIATVDELLRGSDLLPAQSLPADLPGLTQLARVGGPVAPSAGWLVYRRTEVALPGEIEVGPDIGVSGEVTAFSALGRGSGPSEFRLVLGCAGWGPGQLEAEIRSGAWLPAALAAELVFDSLATTTWADAYQLAIGAMPVAFSSKPAKA
jgi:putative transcriptional regulator